MDTLCLHRRVGAVQEALARAGLGGFRLWRIEDPDGWFNLGWLFEYLSRRRHRAIPIADSASFRTREVYLRDRRRIIYEQGREGEVYVVGDCAVAYFTYFASYGGSQSLVIGGERRAGAFQKFLDAYARYERRASRSSGWIEVVGSSAIPRPAGQRWEDVILPPLQKEDLRLQVDSFFAAGELYRKLRIPYRRGLLFTGPPGNGKTSVLRLIASQRPEPFIWLTGRPGEDEERLDKAIDRSIALSPAILCLEDVDSLLTEEGHLSHFLNRLDGLAPMEGVLILATTNHPEKLDEALTKRPSRFDRVFVFANPAEPERRAYLKKQFGPAFDERLVSKSEGFSFAQLKEGWVSACLEAVQAGRAEPQGDAALRAFDRLRDQREATTGEWSTSGPVGFQPRTGTWRRETENRESGTDALPSKP